MKVETHPDQVPVFSPRSIEIVFETQDELDAFGALFNTLAATSAVEKYGGFSTSEIRKAVVEVGGDFNRLHVEVQCHIREFLR